MNIPNQTYILGTKGRHNHSFQDMSTNQLSKHFLSIKMHKVNKLTDIHGQSFPSLFDM